MKAAGMVDITRGFEHLDEAERVAEMRRVEKELAVERRWHDQYMTGPYHDSDDLLVDIEAGNLQLVPDGPDLPFRQHLQDRTDPQVFSRLERDKLTVPYLHPRALHVLHHATAAAREQLHSERAAMARLRSYGFTTIKYCVTSMTRTTAYQQRIAFGGKLATDGRSSHEFGYAFDIDRSGYYGVPADDALGLVAINGFTNSELFDHYVHEALGASLEDLREAGELSYINEIPQGRGAFHVAVSPFGGQA